MLFGKNKMARWVYLLVVFHTNEKVVLVVILFQNIVIIG